MGLVLAKFLASRGAVLSIADVNRTGLDNVLKELPENGGKPHMVTVVDVRHGAEVEQWIKATVDWYGRLDGGINLAGVVTDGVPIAEETDEHCDFLMDVNAKGIFNAMRARIMNMNDCRAIVSFEGSCYHNKPCDSIILT
jgi:NAD(P)-dependent dehydrogenase (short-subunit alcohol dehydrogenase family)